MAATSSRSASFPLSNYDLVLPRLWLVVIALALISLFNSLHFTRLTGFNPDESRWISRAHYVRDFFNPFSPTWYDGYMSRGQPPVGSYVTGLGLLLQGRDLITNGPWNFELAGDDGWVENIIDGNMPVQNDLTAARRTSAGLMALTTIAVFFLARLAVGAPGAVAGALFFAIHPFTAYIGSIATADAAFALFIALSALAAAWLADQPSVKRATLLAVLLGLGAGTKLSPLFVGAPLALLGAGLLIAHRWRSGRWRGDRFAVSLLAMPLAVFAVFVAVNPYLWTDPIGHTLNLFQFRVQEMSTQGSDWPVMAVPTRLDALHRIAVNFSDRYSILGSISIGLQHLTGVSIRPPEIELALALAGGLIWLAIAIRQGARGPAALALLVLLSQVAITVGGMRSEFDRYHVPMAVFGAVSVGVLVGMAMRWRELLDYIRQPVARLALPEKGIERACGSAQNPVGQPSLISPRSARSTTSRHRNGIPGSV